MVLAIGHVVSTSSVGRLTSTQAWWKTSEGPGRAHNTLVAFGPDGGQLAFYRKIHLFDAQGFGESTFIKPGPSTDPVVFEQGECGSA